MSSVGGKCLCSSLCLCIAQWWPQTAFTGCFSPSTLRWGKKGCYFPLGNIKSLRSHPSPHVRGFWWHSLWRNWMVSFQEHAWNTAHVVLSRKYLALLSGSCGVGIKAGWENDKSVLLQLLRFQSLFWFNVATKGKAFECCLQHKHVLKHLILDSFREDQPSSYQYVKWLKTALC